MVRKKNIFLGFVFSLIILVVYVHLRTSSHHTRYSSSRTRLDISVGLDADRPDNDQLDIAKLNILRYPMSDSFKNLAQPAPKMPVVRHKEEDEEEEEMNSKNIRIRDHRFYSIDQELVQEMSLSWILGDLGLRVRLDCRASGIQASGDGQLLIVCLDSTRLMKTAISRKLTKFEAKLLVLKSIFDELGGNGTAIMLRGERAGELSMKFDELVVSTLAPLIARRLQDRGRLKLTVSMVTPARGHNSSYSNIHRSQESRSPDFEKELDLSFLHRADQVKDSSHLELTPAPKHRNEIHHSSKKDMSSSDDEEENGEENGGSNGILLPQKLLKEFKEQTETGRQRARGTRGAHSIKKSHLTALFMSPSLTKLQGYRFMKHRTLLDRGFRANYTFKSPALMSRIGNITAAVERVEEEQRGVALSSLNANLLERANFQHRQVKKFCAKEKFSMHLPGDINQLDTLFKHLLYDDKRRLVFCYVPKNGCSNMKRTFLVLNGFLPASSSKLRYRPLEALLSKVNSFRGLSREGALYRLNNYYKFAILRNPLERLLSAYRNKLERPLNFALVKKFPDRLKAYILTLTNKPLIQKWSKAKNYSQDIHPSFAETLQFMTKFDLSSYNEHFLPFLELCQPCAINYDSFLNLKTLQYDIFALMEYLGIPSEYYPPYRKMEMTRDLMGVYYKHVPATLKNKVYKRLANDLEFYYNLHPEENGMHFNL